jgi:hypothetical protein
LDWKVKFEARIKELVENLPDLAILVEPLLTVRRVLREQITVLHRRLLAIVRDDDVCRGRGSQGGLRAAGFSQPSTKRPGRSLGQAWIFLKCRRTPAAFWSVDETESNYPCLARLN